jgi:membrane protein
MERDHCFLIAGALSYFTLLGIIPLTVVALAVFGVTGGFLKVGEALQPAFQEFLQNGVIPRGSDLERLVLDIEEYARRAASASRGVGVVGAVLFMLAAYPLFDNVERVFSSIWRAERRRAGWARFVAYWVLAGLGPVILAGLVLSVSQMSHWVGADRFYLMAEGARLASKLLAPFIVWVALLLVYRFVPAPPSSRRALLIGSFVATVLWETARTGFGLYLRHVLPVGKIYGAIGVLPILMTWLYLTWVIVLFGAELVNAVDEHRRGEAVGPVWG